METVTLPAAFPAAWRCIYLAQFDHVRNGGQLRDALIAASRTPPGSADRARMDYAFVDARLILSTRQLLTACIQAMAAAQRRRSVVDETQVGFKTPSVHSEILWTLNPNNNIADALRRFGVSAATETLILVRVAGAPPHGVAPQVLVDEMAALVDGVLCTDGLRLPLDGTGPEDSIAHLSLREDSTTNSTARTQDAAKAYKLRDTPVARYPRELEEVICSVVATKYVG
ncbi:hypothetical protein MSPP1_000411 [Malassezia sp. CBS 17886]|nr:hypothetical protein MSPP1_000411 [Malassezia sp. CBS 17886]